MTPAYYHYSLEDVLAIASVHPFYSDSTYPPTREELPTVLQNAKRSAYGLNLASFPLTRKDTLYDLPFYFPAASLITIDTNKLPDLPLIPAPAMATDKTPTSAQLAVAQEEDPPWYLQQIQSRRASREQCLEGC